MKSHAVLITALFLNASAFAQPPDRTAMVRKLVRFQIVAAQAEYCRSELLKLGSQQDVPVFLDPKEPAQSKQRFSSNTMYPTEKAAYDEFSSYCLPVTETYNKLAGELGIAP